MKKVMMVLLLSTVVLGLTACGVMAENQDSQSLTTTLAEQGVREISSGNADTNSDQNANLSIHTQNPASNEMLAGTVQAINGMNLTVDTSSVFVAHETGRHITSGEPQEKQEKIIRVTEQTVIEVQTISNGQITGSRVGALDDLSLQDVVTAEGEWQSDEFIATKLIIVYF